MDGPGLDLCDPFFAIEQKMLDCLDFHLSAHAILYS